MVREHSPGEFEGEETSMISLKIRSSSRLFPATMALENLSRTAAEAEWFPEARGWARLDLLPLPVFIQRPIRSSASIVFCIIHRHSNRLWALTRGGLPSFLGASRVIGHSTKGKLLGNRAIIVRRRSFAFDFFDRETLIRREEIPAEHLLQHMQFFGPKGMGARVD